MARTHKCNCGNSKCGSHKCAYNKKSKMETVKIDITKPPVFQDQWGVRYFEYGGHTWFCRLDIMAQNYRTSTLPLMNVIARHDASYFRRNGINIWEGRIYVSDDVLLSYILNRMDSPYGSQHSWDAKSAAWIKAWFGLTVIVNKHVITHDKFDASKYSAYRRMRYHMLKCEEHIHIANELAAELKSEGGDVTVNVNIKGDGNTANVKVGK